ncbi:hypothetical protein B5M47_03490 [candidate division CPR3 bacterium 4484_211]|uniref:Lactamase n=1 Tax=candidate division CPR3 bacterium 4484_211 TaxID=1968527 RepID=A0A1W9NXE1_UNCC3|nr:MAG: hypothetical protein B5M47_03490 [candidate division CPR3 bacterium 4484_211]
MEIRYLGWSAFKIIHEQTVVIIDPFDPDKVGLPWEKQSADIVCVTHNHFDHNYVEGVEGFGKLINSPGEYEAEGVNVFGILSFHDEKQGRERGFNTMYRLEMGGFCVAHLGDLGTKLTQDQVEDLGSVDVLIIPVGGKYTINYETAAEVVAQIEPALVIPCHYQVPGVKIEGIDPLEKFLEEMGETGELARKKLKLTSRSQLPDETEVVVLVKS